jgi:hypothetical protein
MERPVSALIHVHTINDDLWDLRIPSHRRAHHACPTPNRSPQTTLVPGSAAAVTNKKRNEATERD